MGENNKTDLLKFAGAMATAARSVVQSDAKSLSYKISILENALNEYDNAILDDMRDKTSNSI